jgi:hypothetical protein
MKDGNKYLFPSARTEKSLVSCGHPVPQCVIELIETVLSWDRGAAWTERMDRAANARLVYEYSIFAIAQGSFFSAMEGSCDVAGMGLKVW